MSSETKRKSLIERSGDLYSLLLERFPEHRSKQNVLDVPGICRGILCSNEALYKCLRTDTVKTAFALRLLAYSHENHPETAIYWEDMVPFVMPEFDRYSRDANSNGEDLDDLL